MHATFVEGHWQTIHLGEEYYSNEDSGKCAVWGMIKELEHIWLRKKNSKIIAVVKDLKGCAEEVLGLFHKLEQAEPGLVGGCIRFVPSH